MDIPTDWFFSPENSSSSASLGRADGSDWIHFDGGCTENQGNALAQALNIYDETGKTPAELAASLADAQAEIARLRGALERLADCAQRCDSWESFPQDELDAAYAAISK